MSRARAPWALACLVLAGSAAAVAQDREPRFSLDLTIGQQAPAGSTSTGAEIVSNAETGTITTTYDPDDDVFFEIGAAVRVARSLGIGLAYSSFSADVQTDVSARVPHPFFFDAHRDVAGGVDGLERDETALHLSIRWTNQLGERVELVFFGGPTFFDVSQDVVVDLQLDESFPFDTATLVGASTRELSESEVGFHIGIDVAWLFSRGAGVGLLARYSDGSVDLTEGSNTTPVDVGGVQVGVGLRLRF